jgi:TrbC/VIRB2 pilin
MITHIAAQAGPLEVPMIANLVLGRTTRAIFWDGLRMFRPRLTLFTLLILFPVLASAQSPFDSGFTAMQTLFTGTIAKVASLIAIVVGGYQFAHGEPGAKNVSTPAVQPQVIFSDSGQIVAEQSVCPLNRQPGHIGDLIDRVERGMLFRTRKIRQEVLDPNLAPLGSTVFPFVGRLNLTIKIAYMD